MAERVRYCGLRIVGVIFEISEHSEHSEHSEGLADARPKNPQCVKIRLNRQNPRNLHAPLIAPHYLCKQNAYWPY